MSKLLYIILLLSLGTHAQKATVRAGNWSDPAVWGGKLPGNEDVTINHEIILNVDAAVQKVTLHDGKLIFDPSRTISFQIADFRAMGKSLLSMKPTNQAIHHTIEVIGAKESSFVGGGMQPIDSDPGIWIMGESQLDLQGSRKLAWTTLGQGLAIGSTSITLTETSWQKGDEIVFTPTKKGSHDFSETVIRNANRDKIVFESLSRDHPSNTSPVSAETYYPEVFNITRNVHIRGTANGRTHVFIRSKKPQTIQYVEFRYVGPRRDENGDGIAENVFGRYGIHAHHCMDGSRGSEIIGNVIRDAGNHAFVIHMSNGVLLRDNIAYNTYEDAFWWDEGHTSDDVTYDHNLAAGTRFVNGALMMQEADVGVPSSRPPSRAVNGFQLGMGKGLIAINNCVTGIQVGDAGSGGAYNWEANNETEAWTFKNNVAHNNYNNFRNWQNTRTHHLIEGLVGYNGFVLNVFNGAYANPFRFLDCEFFNGVVEAKAASLRTSVRKDAFGQTWEKCRIEEMLFVSSPLPGETPILVKDCVIGTLTNDAGVSHDGEMVHGVDVVTTKILKEIKMGPNATPNEFIRFQDEREAYKLSKKGKVSIQKFYEPRITPINTDGD